MIHVAWLVSLIYKNVLPFGRANHRKHGRKNNKKLRNASDKTIAFAKRLDIRMLHTDKICDTCRKEIGLTVRKLNKEVEEQAAEVVEQAVEVGEQTEEQLMDVDLDVVDGSEPCAAVQNFVSGSSIDFIDRDWFVKEFNKILPHIGVELIDIRKVLNKSRAYRDHILKSLCNNLARIFFEIPEEPSDITNETNTNDEEMLRKLKNKFAETNDKDSRVKIPSVLPMSWPVRKIQREFDTSRRLGDLTKMVVKENAL